MAIKVVTFDTPVEMTKVHVVTGDIPTEMTKVHVVVGGVPTTVFTKVIPVTVQPAIINVSSTTNSISYQVRNDDSGVADIFSELTAGEPTTFRETLTSGATSALITIGGLTDDTLYTISATADGVDKQISAITRVNERTEESGPPKMTTPFLGNAFVITDTTASMNITNLDGNDGDSNVSVTIGSATEPTGIGGSGGTKTILLSSLLPGTLHTVTASMSDAETSKLDSDNVQKSFTTTGTPKLSTPTNLGTSIVNASVINFFWDAVANGDDYRIVSPDLSVEITASTSITADRSIPGTFRVVARAAGFDDSDEATLIYTVI